MRFFISFILISYALSQDSDIGGGINYLPKPFNYKDSKQALSFSLSYYKMFKNKISVGLSLSYSNVQIVDNNNIVVAVPDPNNPGGFNILGDINRITIFEVSIPLDYYFLNTEIFDFSFGIRPSIAFSNYNVNGFSTDEHNDRLKIHNKFSFIPTFSIQLKLTSDINLKTKFEYFLREFKAEYASYEQNSLSIGLELVYTL